MLNGGGDGESDGKAGKVFSYVELLRFSSIDDAREQMIDEIIDSLLRKSHKEQFIWLENRFGVTLRKDLPAWPTFIEITQRRNIFVHCDGVISKQYLHKCKEDGVKFPVEPSIGERLSVEPEYFDKAHATLYEIGIKLSQVLWRKTSPNCISQADTDLNMVVYELIRTRHYSLAINLSDFACEILKRHADHQMERMMIINRANAYKLSGNPSRASALIDEHDWTASAEMFQLAKAAIADDVDTLIKLMTKIGKDSDVLDARAYREWPLFRPIRQNIDFARAFRKIFKEPLSPPTEEVDGFLEEHDAVRTNGTESGQTGLKLAKKKAVKATTIH